MDATFKLHWIFITQIHLQSFLYKQTYGLIHSPSMTVALDQQYNDLTGLQ